MKEWLVIIIIMLLVISIGLFALNQTLAFYYKSEFLQSPCALCEELNPHLEECFKVESYEPYNQKINISLDGMYP